MSFPAEGIGESLAAKYCRRLGLRERADLVELVGRELQRRPQAHVCVYSRVRNDFRGCCCSVKPRLERSRATRDC